MQDKIVLPLKTQFKSNFEYYSTTFHEIAHSTGHKNRLNRINFYKTDDASYAYEELVAEIASAQLMHMTQTEQNKTFNNSVAYIKSWVSHLKNDNNMILKASKQAEKAVNLIMNITKEEEEKGE